MRYLKAIVGLFYFLRYHKVIKLNKLLKGKRVAIVGAANSTLNTNLGTYIDGFDFVIRINKAPILINSGAHTAHIGKKIDLLYHSFYENDKSGGGALEIELFNALGIRYLINPINNFRGKRTVFNFYKKYLLAYTTYSLPKATFNKITDGLGSFQPTIGFCALISVMSCNFKELYITGFTFFRTPFAGGYRDEVQQPEQVRQLIKNEGHHNVDLEFELFKAKYNTYTTLNIKLDSFLEKLIKSDG